MIRALEHLYSFAVSRAAANGAYVQTLTFDTHVQTHSNT